MTPPDAPDAPRQQPSPMPLIWAARAEVDTLCAEADWKNAPEVEAALGAFEKLLAEEAVMTTPADAPRDLLEQIEDALKWRPDGRHDEVTAHAPEWLAQLVQRVRTAEAERDRATELLVRAETEYARRALGASRPGEPR